MNELEITKNFLRPKNNDVIEIGVDRSFIASWAMQTQGQSVKEGDLKKRNVFFAQLLIDGKIRFYVPPIVLEHIKYHLNTEHDNPNSTKTQKRVSIAQLTLEFLKNNAEYFQILQVPDELAPELEENTDKLARKYSFLLQDNRTPKLDFLPLTFAQNALFGLDTLTEITFLPAKTTQKQPLSHTLMNVFSHINLDNIGRPTHPFGHRDMKRRLALKFNQLQHAVTKKYFLAQDGTTLNLGLDTASLINFARTFGPCALEDVAANPPSDLSKTDHNMLNLLLNGDVVFYVPPTAVEKLTVMSSAQVGNNHIDLKEKAGAMFALGMIEKNPYYFNTSAYPSLRPAFQESSFALSMLYCHPQPAQLMQGLENANQIPSNNDFSQNALTGEQAKIVAENCLLGLDTILHIKGDITTATNVAEKIEKINKVVLNLPFKIFPNFGQAFKNKQKSQLSSFEK